MAYASLRGEAADAGARRAGFSRGLRHAAAQPCTVAAIVDATATQFGSDSAELIARDRRPAVARARKVAMYLARELTDQSLPEIGREFGGRDHSTVLSAVRSISSDVGTRSRARDACGQPAARASPSPR